MSAIINGSSPSVTFSDGTTQATSAIVSGYVPYANLPAGSVLQVVSTANSTSYSGTSGAEVYTGVSASITPKYATSKILVIYQLSMGAYTASTNAAYQLILRRGTTTAGTLLARARCGVYRNGEVEVYSSMILSALDSPATTSAVSYGVFTNNIDGTNTWSINASSGISNLTLMEIAA